jgi:hypothetical protein
MGHVAAPELPLRKAKPRSVGHMAAPELLSSSRQGPELRDTWQCRSSPQQVGEVWDHGTHGSTGAHLSKEARSGAAGHVVAPEPTSTGRCGLKLQLMWSHMDTRPAPCLDLELVCRGTQSSGY